MSNFDYEKVACTCDASPLHKFERQWQLQGELLVGLLLPAAPAQETGGFEKGNAFPPGINGIHLDSSGLFLSSKCMFKNIDSIYIK